MLIESLKALVPPSGYTARGWVWPQVEALIGLTLPDDFKQIVTYYGPGIWADWIILFTPVTAGSPYDLESWPADMLEQERGFLGDLTAEQRAEEFPYRLYPEAGGLYPFALSAQGDRFFWRTVGPPDEWPVVLSYARDTATTEFPFGIGELLERYLRNELDEQAFPRHDSPPDKLFVQFPNFSP